MLRFLRFMLFFFILLVVGYFVYTGKIHLPRSLAPDLPQASLDTPSSTLDKESFAEVIQKVQNNVSAPAPLRVQDQTKVPATESEGALTRAGVIAKTNDERRAAGLSPLRENALLDKAAEAKVKDMFAGQYFEHVSPSGVGVDDLARNAGYQYMLVGENLALGNFENDIVLVDGWMNSPGHRANILKPGFQEIGVAVGRGMFEGHMTWLAVQEFGTPATVCAEPDARVRARLDASQTQLNTWESELQTRQAELERMRGEGSPEYNDKVDEYNTLVAEYNALAQESKALAQQYNAQVNAYNGCLQQFSS